MMGESETPPGDERAARWRAAVAAAVRAAAAIACLGSAYQAATSGFANGWLLLSVLTAAVVATGPAHWHRDAALAPAPPWPPRPQWTRALLPGWLLLAVASLWPLLGLSPLLKLATWVIGLVWVVAGAHALSRDTSAPGVERCGPGAVLWALFVVWIAAAVRLWEIDMVPREVHSDEGFTAMMGLEVFRNPQGDWLGMQVAQTYTTMHLCYLLVGVGPWIGGFNIVAARMPDVVLGILSVLLVFDGLRRVAGTEVAVVAALLLAGNHCHIGFSRIASSYIQTAFVVSLVFSLFCRAWTAPTYRNAVLLAIAVGLGAQTYRASLLMLPLLALVAVVLACLRPARMRALAAPLTIFAITGIAVTVPFGVALTQHWGDMMGRAHDLNIFTPWQMEHLKSVVYQTDSTAEVVAHQAWNSLRGFYLPLNTQPQYGSAHYGMSDPFSAALMVPGAVLALLSLHRAVAVFALVFTVGYLLFGLGMQWGPGFNRATGALPGGMILVAIALVQCTGAITGSGRLGRWLRGVCVAAALVGCVGMNLWIYFVDNAWIRGWGDRPSEAGWAALAHAADHTVHLVNEPMPGNEGLRLILGTVDGMRPGIHLLPRETVAADYVAEVRVLGPTLFILDADDVATREALLRRFPDARGELWARHPERGPRLHLAFVAPPAATHSGNAVAPGSARGQ